MIPQQVHNQVLDKVNCHVEKLDIWMSKIVPIESIDGFQSIGFKQLNDLLLLKNFPHYFDFIENNISNVGDDDMLLSYADTISSSLFLNFGVREYYYLIESRLTFPVSDTWLSGLQQAKKNGLLQNLIFIAYSIERWGQYVLGNKPGKSLDIVMISGEISIGEYLKRNIPNFNTFEYFALRSVSTVNTFYCPKFVNGRITKGDAYSIESMYDKLYFPNDRNRFPSITKIDSFHILLKKCELTALAYNKKIIKSHKLIEEKGLLDESVIKKINEITLLFKISKSAFSEFLHDKSFNEYKFIYILRQMTVELDLSPFDIIFDRCNLRKKESIRVKSFVNHYLIRKKLSKREKVLFLLDIIENEGIVLLDETNLLCLREKIDSEIKRGNTVSDKKILTGLINEIVYSQEVGVNRIQYVLHKLKQNFPKLEKRINKIQESEKLLADIQTKINTLNYKLAPSGANSVAYYGPDVFLGHYSNVINYNIHMLNRISVMSKIDQDNYWALDELKAINLESMLKNYIPNDILACNETTILSEYIKTNQWICYYIDLFEEFASLSSLHLGVVEKYLNRFSRAMNMRDKLKMKSTPEHGTTFMQPDSDNNEISFPSLPSLKSLAEIRRNHMFKLWVKPLQELRKKRIVKTSPCEQFCEKGLNDYFSA